MSLEVDIVAYGGIDLYRLYSSIEFLEFACVNVNYCFGMLEIGSEPHAAVLEHPSIHIHTMVLLV